MDVASEKLLISEIHQREILWDRSNPNFGNSYKKGKEWDAVAAKLRYPKQTIKNKWRSLTNKFNSEANLEDATRSADGVKAYVSEWMHFKSLQFLSDENNDSLLEDEEEFDDAVSEDSIPAFKPASKKPSNQLSKSLPVNMKRRSPLAEKAVNQKTVISVDSEMSDEELLFFQTLLKHSRKIDPEHALAFRNEVNDVVQKYAYKKHLLKPKKAKDSEEECVIVEEYNIPTKKKRTSATNVSIKKEIKREIKVEPTHETADTSNKESMMQEAAVYPPMFGPMFPYAYSASMYPPFYQNQASYLQGMPGPSSIPLYGNDMIRANQMMLAHSTISQEQWHASQAGIMACSPMLSTGRSNDADTREPVPASTSMQSDHASNFQHGSTNTTSPPEDKDINEYITI